jgi:3-hydroxyisobutyrate dehydrogenase-like beta-hydroxyacid dehydrogenase
VTAAAPAMTVAVLGTGRMGSAMARSLGRAGLSLVVWNRTRDRAEALAGALDARVASTPAEAASLADVTLTMLADDAALEHVYRGPDGLLAGVRPGSILVDLSTVTPATIRSLAASTRAAGAALLDAPVSGSTATAESGQLTLMVGGDVADLERARPALDPLAKAIFHLGPVGSGSAMKLAVNTVIFGLNNALSEALALAEAAGIDRTQAYDVLSASAAGAPFVAYKRAAFLDPDGTPTAFSLQLAEKDLRLIAGLAESLGLALPQVAVNLDLIRGAGAGGKGHRDFSFVAEFLRSAGSRAEGTGPPADDGEAT